MKKTFILDTSVFVFDPYCLTNKKFTSQDIIIPIQILEELDKLKKGFGEAAKNARLAIRQLDSIENLHIGQKLENKSFVKIQTEGYDKIGEDDKYNDNKILACVQACKKKNKVLLSQDINLRVRAKALGLDAEDYKEEKKDVEEFYSGIIEVKNDDWVQEIMEKDLLTLKIKRQIYFRIKVLFLKMIKIKIC